MTLPKLTPQFLKTNDIYTTLTGNLSYLSNPCMNGFQLFKKNHKQKIGLKDILKIDRTAFRMIQPQISSKFDAAVQ